MIASYARFFYSLYAVLLMGQLDRALAVRDFADVVARVVAAFAVGVLIGPLVHLVLTALLFPLSRRSSALDPERVSAFVSPFLLCYLYVPIYLTGRLPAPAVRVSFWAVPLVLVLIRLGASGPLRPSAVACRSRLAPSLRASLSHSLRGSVELARGGFLPEALFPPEGRSPWLEPILFPLLAAYALLLVRFGPSAGGSPVRSSLLVLFTLAPPFLLIRSARAAAGRSRRLLAALFGLAWTAQFFLLLFHFTTDSPLDASLLLTHKDTMLRREAFAVYGSRLRWPVLAGIVLVGLVWPLVIRKRFKFFPSRSPGRRPGLAALAWPALMAVLFLTGLPSLDEFALFGRSIQSRLRERITPELARLALSTPFPYVRPHFPLSFEGPRGDRPDVFVVLLESFNARLVERKAPNGVEITPFFNSLIPQGVYVEDFYNNSIQTSRALFIIFSGIYESYKGKAFHDLAGLNLRTLPDILDDEGYRTVFFNAHDDLNFDNKGPYLRKMGFRELVAMTGPLVADVPADKFWNWGIQDDLFFRKSFDWLDATEARGPPAARTPIFASFLTLVQHNPHDRVPPPLRLVYPAPKGRAEHFMNSQYLTDMFLREFFAQLARRPRHRDAIVILLGDHSFPAGEHGTWNEQGYFEESFRTPLLVLWPDHLRPARIRGTAYDQVDLAPTVMDLLGLDRPNHFVGRSLFAPAAPRPLLLTQPYDGVYLAVVDYPFKYVRHLIDGHERLFNVDADPGETRDLSADPSFADRLKRGRLQLEELKKNQVLLEMNRVWDPRLSPPR
jgi:arylsulfatase A-like enzyme